MKKSLKQEKSSGAGKVRAMPRQQKQLRSLTNLMNMGGKELNKQVLKTKPSKTPLNKKERIEIEKMKKLFNKVDRVLRARSASKYLPMPRVFGPSKRCIFETLVRFHNCSFEDLVKSVQSQSPWIPPCLVDTSCHSIQKAAFAIGWKELLGDDNLLIQQNSGVQQVSTPKVWKMMKFTGALKKLEKFRTQLTKRLPSNKKKILLPMLQRAAARTYSNFKAVTDDGENPYEELAHSDLSSMNGYSKSFFKEIGKPSLSLALLDIWCGTTHMSELIDEIPETGTFPLSAQRALKKAAADCLLTEKAKFKKIQIYKDLSEWIFPSAF